MAIAITKTHNVNGYNNIKQMYFWFVGGVNPLSQNAPIYFLTQGIEKSRFNKYELRLLLWIDNYDVRRSDLFTGFEFTKHAIFLHISSQYIYRIDENSS